MKKINKKGFTLIELMAVVIVLIIIIFIAINKINDSTQRTRNNALIANAGSYIKAVNSFVAEEYVNNDDVDSGFYTVKELEELGVKISGTKPTKGAVVFNDAEVLEACLIIDGYKLEYKNGKVNDPKAGKCNLSFTLEKFEYSGSYQQYTVTSPGYYRIELWGAQGGSNTDSSDGGKGGYTSGDIYLEAGTTLYFYVGGEGPAKQSVTNTGGYNGGGYSGNNSGSYSYGGGGATDVRLTPGVWNDAVSLRSRIMVAGGGGGSFSTTSYTRNPGVGGNLQGGSDGGNYSSTVSGGGKQTGPGTALNTSKQGSYGFAPQSNVDGWGGGGGGGYWGGSMGNGRAGGGGSSYISGYKGAVAVISQESNSPRLSSSDATCAENSTDVICSYHYSGYKFSNGVMKSGKEVMPKHSGSGKMTGNTGNGYAKVSRVYSSETDNGSYTPYIFEYTGNVQQFKAPATGKYKVELWGASSIPKEDLKASIKTGGSYTSGEISLEKDTILYVYVGQEGYMREPSSSVTFDNTEVTFNGGGKGNRQCDAVLQYGGIAVAGGATDIRVVGGSWDNEESLRSRIMVAAASGGTSYNSNGSNTIGGPGGGIVGYDGTKGTYGTGATQVSGGSTNGTFGKGGNGSWTASVCNDDAGNGGGGGWYGGGGTTVTGAGSTSSGGSGSSYISGHAGCVAVESTLSSLPKSGCDTGTSNVECSKSPYNYYFTNTVMIDGAGYQWTNSKQDSKKMPNPNGGEYGIGQGHIGNGYAKITQVS